jgi:hypothetical protein
LNRNGTATSDLTVYGVWIECHIWAEAVETIVTVKADYFSQVDRILEEKQRRNDMVDRSYGRKPMTANAHARLHAHAQWWRLSFAWSSITEAGFRDLKPQNEAAVQRTPYTDTLVLYSRLDWEGA